MRRASVSAAAVEPVRDPPDLAADVLQQAEALLGDRSPDLRRLGDALDELLRLVAFQQPVPDLVDQRAVERVDRRPLHRRAREQPLDRLLDGRPFEHPDQRALDRRALERADDRLLGGEVDGVVDAGRLRDGARASRAAAQQREPRTRDGASVVDPPPLVGRLSRASAVSELSRRLRRELTARRVDVATSGEPDRGAQAASYERATEGLDHAALGAFESRAGRVVRDQVQLEDARVEDLRQLPRQSAGCRSPRRASRTRRRPCAVACGDRCGTLRERPPADSGRSRASAPSEARRSARGARGRGGSASRTRASRSMPGNPAHGRDRRAPVGDADVREALRRPRGRCRGSSSARPCP